MAKERWWEVRRFRCPEEDRTASLLIEWGREKGKTFIRSLCCDNPRLEGPDNWECGWSCWEKVGLSPPGR